MVRRGVMLHLMERRFSIVPELVLASGRRADIAALSQSGDVWIVEIKSSVEDFRTDQKWPEYRAHCDRFFFATHSGVPEDIFPQEAGFFLADAHGAHQLRDAPDHRLAAATRKAMLIRFARAAADRACRLELHQD